MVNGVFIPSEPRPDPKAKKCPWERKRILAQLDASGRASHRTMEAEDNLEQASYRLRWSPKQLAQAVKREKARIRREEEEAHDGVRREIGQAEQKHKAETAAAMEEEEGERVAAGETALAAAAEEDDASSVAVPEPEESPRVSPPTTMKAASSNISLWSHEHVVTAALTAAKERAQIKKERLDVAEDRLFVQASKGKWDRQLLLAHRREATAEIEHDLRVEESIRPHHHHRHAMLGLSMWGNECAGFDQGPAPSGESPPAAGDTASPSDPASRSPNSEWVLGLREAVLLREELDGTLGGEHYSRSLAAREAFLEAFSPESKAGVVQAAPPLLQGFYVPREKRKFKGRPTA